MAKNSSPSRAPAQWRSTPDDLEERETRRISRRKTPPPPPEEIVTRANGVDLRFRVPFHIEKA